MQRINESSRRGGPRQLLSGLRRSGGRPSGRRRDPARHHLALPLGAGALLALLSLVGDLGCGRAPAAGPHVVLISIDTLRADHVGLYGYERDTTPRLDRFFGTGTVFENAWSSAPCTIPSVRQFLSGGVDIRPDREPLAEVLRERGYATAAIVSQHFFWRKPASITQGFEGFDIQGRDEVDQHGWSARQAREVSDRALAWLEVNHRSEKFFLWLHYFDPHDPYEPPREFREFDHGNESAKTGDRRTYMKEARRRGALGGAEADRGGHSFDEQDVAHFINLYDGEIAFTDAQIGRILDDLERRDLIGRAIVVLIADHGEKLGEGDRWDHCETLSDLEIRVPFLISVNGGRLGDLGREEMPASTLDVLPTVLGLLGIDYDASSYHGADLSGASPDRIIVSNWMGSTAIRDREWKLVYQGRTPDRLYHLSRDREERWNLIGTQPQIVGALDRLAEPFLGLATRAAREDDRTVQQLRSIGYIQP